MAIFSVGLLILWLAHSLKSSLFWLYLFQLKEYKLLRLADHFRTQKGQRLLLDPLNISKIGLLFVRAIIPSYLAYAAISLYSLEALFLGKSIIKRKIKRPILTAKSIPLVAAVLFVQLALGLASFVYALNEYYLSVFLLALDVLTPVIILLIVSGMKPINYILRRKVINQAREKIAGLPDLLVIGIVGSYGKTSTKEFLYEVLKSKFNVVKTPEHVNTEIGVANFIINNLSKKNEIFICEMGAYEKGEVKAIAGIVHPRIGIFVGANEQHLSLFGSMENLLSAEGGAELLAEMPARGLAIFNGNNRYAYDLYKKTSIPKRITYAPNLTDIINPEKRDVRAENITVGKDSLSFKVLTAKNSRGVEFKVNLLGRQNVENILLVAAVAEELGMNLQEIAEGCRIIKTLPRTMSLSRNNRGINVIDSTYSSNPNAAYSHLEYLKVWDKSKKIVVMPCLIELGGASAKVHHEIGKKLAEICDLAIITTKERFGDIMSGAKENPSKDDAAKRIIHIEDPIRILSVLENEAKKGDVILLEGRLPESLINGLQ